jgi:hypothetical protein
MKLREFLFGVVLLACLLPVDLFAQHNVKLSGNTNHFGIDISTGEYIDYWATVPGEP